MGDLSYDRKIRTGNATYPEHTVLKFSLSCLSPWILPAFLLFALVVLRIETLYVPRSMLAATDSVKDAPVAFQCTSDILANTTTWFAQYNSAWQLNCGDSLTVNAIFRASPSRKGKKFINIGANKGYFSLGWVLRWAPEYKLTLRQLEDYWTTFRGIHAPEGGCGDAFEIVEDTTAIYERQSESMGQPTDAQFWAVEAAPKTFEYLSKSPLVMYGPVEVLHAAASDADGTLAFEDCPIGHESCMGAYHEKGALLVDVRAVTVDSLLDELLPAQKYDDTQLLWLQIDAEGMDPLILNGAKKSLASGKIGVLGFEYHAVGHWSAGRDSLKRVSTWLLSMHYSCFLESKTRLWALSVCWHDGYETNEMSNIFCVHHSRTDLLSTLYALSNMAPHVRFVRSTRTGFVTVLPIAESPVHPLS